MKGTSTAICIQIRQCSCVQNYGRKYYYKISYHHMPDVRRRTCARTKYRRFQSAITFESRRILTYSLKLLDNIAEILPNMNFQNNQKRGKCTTRLAKKA